MECNSFNTQKVYKQHFRNQVRIMMKDESIAALMANQLNVMFDKGRKLSSHDTGRPWVMIGLFVYSLACLLLLPISVSLCKKWETTRREKHFNIESKQNKDIEMVECEIIDDELGSEENQGRNSNGKDNENSPTFPQEQNIISRKQSHAKDGKYMPISNEEIECNCEANGDDSSLIVHRTRKLFDQMGGFLSKLADIATYDKETKRLIKLGTPFMISEVSEALFEALTIILISRFCQIDALSAYIASLTLVELSLTLIGGIGEAITTLCSHAIGAGNYKMAGAYAQISTILYVILSIPFLGMWWFFMDDCLQLFGLSETSVDIGTQYTKIVIFHYMLEGVYGALFVLLDVDGYENYTTLYGLFYGGFELILMWVLLATVDGFDLFWVGVTHLCVDIFLNSIFLGSAIWLGWFDPFWEGLVKTFSLTNKSAVMNVLSTAIPLSIGSLLETGEWQVLTIFAAVLGPIEVTAWGLMASIWELFEAATEGFAEAGSIRLAKHLGKGKTKPAKKCSGKALFIATCLSIVVTIMFYLSEDSIAAWLTDDETLQGMINSMIPFIAFGNIFMAFGTTSWALVGAQGRFRLGNIIAGIVSCFVTIPLAALFSFVLHLGLNGLIASIVVGYTTVSFCMSFVLLMSDWDAISMAIIKQNTEDDESNM